MVNDINLLLVFIVFNILNVVIQTTKSLCTIKCEKLVAALVNAIAYGFYTYIIVLTMCELPLLVKAVVVAVCNFIGVFVVKFIEEKLRKDKLWKVEVTIPSDKAQNLISSSKDLGLSFNYVNIEKYYLFNFYCPTQKDSAEVKKLLKFYDAKYFVSESKVLD